MIHFVGAGSGAPDLITVRGKRFLETADIVIYAGSLVNPQLLSYTKSECELYNSAKMTLEEVLQVMEEGEAARKDTVRLHTLEIRVFTGQSGSRWIFWMRRASVMIPVQASVPFAGRHLP